MGESEQICRALEHREDRAAGIMTPPCDCPRCQPERFYERNDTGDDGWLRMSGTRQRFRVERFELGATGRAVLG